jgi:hypothetical protein
VGNNVDNFDLSPACSPTEYSPQCTARVQQTGKNGTMTIIGATIANNSATVRRTLDPLPPRRVALRGSDTSVAGVCAAGQRRRRE